MNLSLLFLLGLGSTGVVAVSTLVGSIMYKTYKEELDVAIEKAELVQGLPSTRLELVESTPDDEQSLRAPIDSGYTLVTGSMGGGKTTALCAIALKRYLSGHRVAVFTSHIKYNTWQIADEVYGKGKTTEQRSAHLKVGVRQYLKVIEQRYSDLETKPQEQLRHEPITLIFDEYGDYTEMLGKELCQKMAHIVGSATRKVNFYIVIATQNPTKEFLGNVNGVHALMVQKSVHLRLSSQPNPTAVGGLSPTGRGTLTLMGGKEFDVSTESLVNVLPDTRNPENFEWLIDVERELGVRNHDVKQLVS